MSRCFKSGEKISVDETTSSCFFDINGSALLEELISTFNGRQEVPIRCFTAKELISATNNFVDKGSGQMYRGCINERPVLVKYIYGKSQSKVWDKLVRFIIRDIAITSQMSHLKNVLKLSGCCLEFKYPAFVYEYVEYEGLYNLLHDSTETETSLPWRNRIQIALGIANTVLYLHTGFQTPIIHRNLKPYNVIIDQHNVAKLVNFSDSITLPQGESRVADNIRASGHYPDPEYMASGFVTLKSDVYSFGMILLDLVTGQNCYKREEHDTLHIVDYVLKYMEKDQLSQIIDPKLVKQGYDPQQWQAMFDLGIRCTRAKGEDRPEMIDVARELRHMEKSFKEPKAHT